MMEGTIVGGIRDGKWCRRLVGGGRREGSRISIASIMPYGGSDCSL